MKTSQLKALITRALKNHAPALRALAERLQQCTPDGAEVRFIVSPIAHAWGVVAWNSRDTWREVSAVWSQRLNRRADELDASA